MTVLKYLLDEHVDPDLRKALKQRFPDMVVWRIGDVGAPPFQTSDPEALIWCEENGFSLVTNNRASIPGHLQDHLAAGKHVPGIFILNPRMAVGETADELALIWGASDSGEYTDQLRYLPIS